MHYIVFDLEFNQDFSSLQNFDFDGKHYPFEVLQIAALKLDASFHTLGTFNRYVKPSFYQAIGPYIQNLTGITLEKVLHEATFPEVYTAFLQFIGPEETVFCTWGMSDMKELFRNLRYHHLSSHLLPHHYINIQPFVSKHFNQSSKKLMSLERAVEALAIPKSGVFHDASCDAYYTSEIFKKLYSPAMKPSLYALSYRAPRPAQNQKQLDTTALLGQFEKMYQRSLTQEEQAMVILAYKMGKTGQFLKDR